MYLMPVAPVREDPPEEEENEGPASSVLRGTTLEGGAM
jgi:hypothetical protein